jgi:adenylate cyclase class 2
MSNNDIEIEIKIQLNKKQFFEIKERIEKIARFEKSTYQRDEYFTPFHRNFVTPKFPFEWLSIRKRGDKAFLNYKHFYPEDGEVKTHCDEFETEIKNPEQLRKIFLALDFKELVTVEKKREIYIYDDKFEIAFDIVKDLGYFIEIEALKDFGGIKMTRERLFEFAKNLGIDISKICKRGYPYLLMEKKGLLNNKINIKN